MKRNDASSALSLPIPFPFLCLLLLCLWAWPLAAQEGEHSPHRHEGHHEHHGEHEEHHGEHEEHHGEHEEHHGDHPHHQQGFQHDFDDVERWVKVFDDPERVLWQKPEEVVEKLGVEKGMRVADLGAGTGFFLDYLSPAVGEEGEVLALDVSEPLVEHMRQRAAEARMENVTARVVEPDDPGLEAGSVDRILVVDVWHHISNRGDYAARLHEDLSPGGRVMVVDFTLESPEGPPKEHRLPPEAVAEELRAGGFEVEILEETLPRQYVVVGTKG